MTNISLQHDIHFMQFLWQLWLIG